MRYTVATDGSEESDDAIRHAAVHAGALGATLDIVHAIEPEAELRNGELVLPGSDRATELGRETLAAGRQVAEDVARERDADFEIETRLLAGRPADAITDYANESGADAIYVGHRGLTEEREMVLGSVAKSVVDKATVPVTVIR
ncbi:universal stress protein [Haloarcula onubensis]|uniref:Universal stress protein n=1 Tax=Haloarcula onubensis TaxID=2950539 RepID=A0ABU2FLJ6_9EURY|nr:universal stress protein [Halomicroarcula sp. S3CR25-11]MDS0281641.1 universal stress protein [Halomicroarcula sp. S3CR25-11]